MSEKLLFPILAFILISKLALADSVVEIEELKNSTSSMTLNSNKVFDPSTLSSNVTKSLTTNATLTSKIKKLEKLSPNLKAENKKAKQAKTTKAATQKSTIVQKLATKKSKGKTTATTKGSTVKVVLKKIVNQKNFTAKKTSTKKVDVFKKPEIVKNATKEAPTKTTTVKSVLLGNALEHDKHEKLHSDSSRVFGKNFQQKIDSEQKLEKFSATIKSVLLGNALEHEKHEKLHSDSSRVFGNDFQQKIDSEQKSEKSSATIKSVLLGNALEHEKHEKLHSDSSRIFGKNFQQKIESEQKLINFTPSLKQLLNESLVIKKVNFSFLHKNLLLPKNSDEKFAKRIKSLVKSVLADENEESKKNSSVLFRTLLLTEHPEEHSVDRMKSLLMTNEKKNRLKNFSFGSLLQTKIVEDAKVKSESLSNVQTDSKDERNSFQPAFSSVLSSSVLDNEPSETNIKSIKKRENMPHEFEGELKQLSESTVIKESNLRNILYNVRPISIVVPILVISIFATLLSALFIRKNNFYSQVFKALN
jgi:hypothetical protein